MTEELPPQRKIIHVDMDAFFASVEQRDNPELAGKPVAVGSPAARGVVAAASYEARQFGVHSAMASVVAARKCPSLIFTPPRFEVYRAISAHIREIFAEHTDLIEPLSLDEAYLDVTVNKQDIPIATEIANRIRQAIFEATGLTASAGIGPNKFIAKMASGMNKPNGFCVITPAKATLFMESLRIEKFHGVGPATAARMKSLGIATGADLKALTLPQLEQRFGRSARYYYDLCRGIDHRPVQPNRERKSVGAEDTFAIDIDTVMEAHAHLAPLIDKVWAVITKRELAGRTVTLKIKFADFTLITRSRSRGQPVRGRADFEDLVEALLAPEFPPEMPVRLLGVTLSGFELEGTPLLGQLRLEI